MWWILAMGLADLLGDCRAALRKGRKYQMVKTQTESHDRRPVVGRSGFPFPLRSVGGRLEFITQILGGSPKLFSSGLAISMTNLIDSFI